MLIWGVAWLESGGESGESQDDDEDLKSDPIAQIDLPVCSFRFPFSV